MIQVEANFKICEKLISLLAKGGGAHSRNFIIISLARLSPQVIFFFAEPKAFVLVVIFSVTVG